MRALLYTQSFDFEVCELDASEPRAGEVLLRVEAAGICGSDLQGVATRSPRRTPPLIMGHELTGEVMAAGDPAGKTLVGRRVAVNPQIPCRDCRACRSGRENVCRRRALIGGTRAGGFADYVSVPVHCIHPLSSDVAPEVAVFSEPLATCVHALGLAPEPFIDVAVVLGAGTIGVLAAQVLRLAGARLIVVSEVDPERLEIARAVADAVAGPAELHDVVMEATAGAGAGLSIDAVGSDSTRHESLRVLQSAGTAIWLGMHDQTATIPAFDLVVSEQRVLGSFAYTNPEFERAVGMLEHGLIRPLVSSRLVSLGDSGDVFRELLAGDTGGFLKAIISPGAAGDAPVSDLAQG